MQQSHQNIDNQTTSRSRSSSQSSQSGTRGRSSSHQRHISPPSPFSLGRRPSTDFSHSPSSRSSSPVSPLSSPRTSMLPALALPPTSSRTFSPVPSHKVHTRTSSRSFDRKEAEHTPTQGNSVLVSEMELVLRCPYSLTDKIKPNHLIKEPLTTPCCGKTFCRDCLPKYLASLSPIEKTTQQNKSNYEDNDVLLCECGARLSKEDRQVLSHSCSNQALVSVIQTYRSFLSRLSSSFLPSSNTPTPNSQNPTGFFSSILNSR